MYKPHARVRGIVSRDVAEMPCQGIDQCAVVIAVSRMHNHACRLIDDKHSIILVHDIQRNILCHNLESVTRTIHDYLYNIQRFDAVIGLNGASIDPYTPGIGSHLYTIARGMLHAQHQKFVYAYQLLTLVSYKTEMLIHSARLQAWCIAAFSAVLVNIFVKDIVILQAGGIPGQGVYRAKYASGVGHINVGHGSVEHRG